MRPDAVVGVPLQVEQRLRLIQPADDHLLRAIVASSTFEALAVSVFSLRARGDAPDLRAGLGDSLPQCLRAQLAARSFGPEQLSQRMCSEVPCKRVAPASASSTSSEDPADRSISLAQCVRSSGQLVG